MYKLIKFLKPFVIPIVFAVVLLFSQAMAELALPDYMSNIVNIGIQQGGVERAIPEEITESEMNKILSFLDTEDSEFVLDNYTFVDSTSDSYDEYSDKYTQLEGESIYSLKKIEDEKIDELELVMAKAIFSVGGIQQMMSISEETGEDIDLNGQSLPAGTDIFLMLEQMPEEQRMVMLEGIEEQIEQFGESMVLQSGTVYINSMYDDMGLNLEAYQRDYILRIGGIMIIITLIGAACSISVGFIAARVAAGLGRDLRRKIFNKVEGFSNTEMDKFSTSSLITRSTNDITQIQNLMVIMIRMVIYAPILGLGGVIKAVGKSSSMTWIIALAIIVLIGVVAIVFIVAIPKFKLIQKLVDKLNLVTRENLSGMMVVRAFNTQDFEEKRFDKANTDVTDTNLFVNRVMAFIFPIMMFVMNIVTVAIVWVGAHQIADATMQVGDMMAFMQYAMQIIFAFIMLSFMFILLPRASVSALRIAEVLETENEILDPKEPKKFHGDTNGVLAFNNVSFRYPAAEEDMLKKIDFVAEPGKTTAIIGSTGSGKTTLVNLIQRFYDVTDGSVTIDGIDVRDVTQHDLREITGYVPQKAKLFSGTIESNLKISDENASQELIEKSAEIAQAMEFINQKEDKFDSHIAQGGDNVSGGQKQRLSIARALVKEPKIYVFDDSFSALDFKTDAKLRKALKEITGDKTVLIVAQRISTIKNAEQIIVLDDGKMVGKGTHDELMKNCETYKEIAYSQLSKEELA